MSAPDEELMRRYQAGDVRAFDALLDRYKRPLFQFIYRSVGNAAAAEDVLQETFMRVIRTHATYQHQAKVSTWLYTIARNLCVDHARRAKHRAHASLDAPFGGDEGGSATLLDRQASPDADQAALLGDAEFNAALQRLLGELPLEQREVFVLREIQDLSFKEIADVVGISENTAKSRMRYALEKLRSGLAEFLTDA